MTQLAIEKRYKGCQTFLKEGCLFLSLCSIVEQVTDEPVDILEALAYAKQQHLIDSDNSMSESHQCEFLWQLTGKRWHRVVSKALANPVPKEMYTVEKWENPRTGLTHFRRRFVDTLSNSITVKEGTLVAYYCYCYES